MMQRRALAIAKHLGKFDDALLAGGQQLLAGKFRGRPQIEWARVTVHRHERGSEGVQMGFIAGRDLQGSGLNLDEFVIGKPAAQCRHDAPTRQKDRSPVGMNVGRPKARGQRRNARHIFKWHIFKWPVLVWR